MDGTANERITYCSAGKDQTDLEIAINWALEQKPALIRILVLLVEGLITVWQIYRCF